MRKAEAVLCLCVRVADLHHSMLLMSRQQVTCGVRGCHSSEHLRRLCRGGHLTVRRCAVISSECLVCQVSAWYISGIYLAVAVAV